MGFWGSSLYANDCSSDVRDCYMGLLEKAVGNDRAYQETLESFAEYINTDEEPLFWYALADTQWRVGRLLPEVKEKALYWIDRKGGLEFWAESKTGGSGWLKTLDKLKEKLHQEQPREKKITNPADVPCNPGEIGDVYAYCFHTTKAEEAGYYGKYILLQKIGEEVADEGRLLSCIRVFDQLYDEIPTAPQLDKIRSIPFDLPYRFLRKEKRPGHGSVYPKLSMCPPMYMRSKRNYPEKFLHYIGSYPIPTNPMLFEHWRGSYAWVQLEESLLFHHQDWQNFDYQLFETKSVVTRRSETGE